jgi:hypothetical protein
MTFLGVSIVKWIVIGALYAIPGYIILRKIGYSGWWVVTLFIPVVGLLMPWALALSRQETEPWRTVLWSADAESARRTRQRCKDSASLRLLME